MRKYMTKDAFQQTNSLVLRLLAQTREKIFAYPSKALDAGTAERNTKYFVTMTGNKINALCEYSDTVVMLDMLGVKSFYSTHNFQHCNIRAAVKHQYMIQSPSNDISSGDDTESEDGDDVVDDREDVSDAVERIMKTGDDNEELDLLKVCNKLDTDTQQSLQIVIIKDATTRTRKIIKAQQFEDYRHRSKQLEMFSLYYYIVMVKRVRKRKQQYGENKAQRRVPNARLPFSSQHPLSTTHEHQCIITCDLVPKTCVSISLTPSITHILILTFCHHRRLQKKIFT